MRKEYLDFVFKKDNIPIKNSVENEEYLAFVKDIDDELNAPCVGVLLEDGRRLGAPPARCLYAVAGVIHLCKSPWASPKEIHEFLGVLQWYDLLCRPKLSIYDRVYTFVRDRNDTTRRVVPKAVLRELLSAVMLAVHWRVDLTRPYAPLIAASDASTEFGFGVSVNHCDPAAAQAAAQDVHCRDCFHLLDAGLRGGHYKERRGTPYTLPCSLRDFTHVLSVKAKRHAHINCLEGEAFLLLVRWLLRARSRHATRVVVLCDSAVWTGAQRKGRSSSQLNFILQRTAALELIGDLSIIVLLVPSEEMPADPPSRGVRWRPSASVQAAPRYERPDGGILSELLNCLWLA